MDSTVVYSVTRIHQFNGNCRNINENIRRQASSDRSVLQFLTQTELMASFSFSLDQLPQREWNHVHACQLFFCFFWFSQNLSFSNSRLTLGLRNFSEVGGNVHVLWLSKHCAGHGVVRARGGGGGGHKIMSASFIVLIFSDRFYLLAKNCMTADSDRFPHDRYKNKEKWGRLLHRLQG